MLNTCYRCRHAWEDREEPGYCPECGTWNQSERFKRTIRHDDDILERPRLTPAEEAEAQKLYAEFMEDIAQGKAWGIDPKNDL